VDLARAAGVSTQHVRNLEAAGVLPPAPRTVSGYRRYDTGHLDALLAYRALAAGHGLETAQAVLRAVHAGENSTAFALIDESHARHHEQRRALDEAARALETLAGQDVEATTGDVDLSVGQLARVLRVRPSALRVWESAGLLAPRREAVTRYRRYAPADVRDARIVHLLRQGRYSFTQIKPVLDGLHRAGNTDALRAAISERRAALDRQTTAMLDGGGRLHRYLAGVWTATGESPPTGPTRRGRTPA
jgi:DNA-binding transcriptional MerR regulator